MNALLTLAVAVVTMMMSTPRREMVPDVPPASVVEALSQAAATTWMSPGFLASAAQCVLGRYGSLIDQYRGVIPASVVAVRIAVETGSRSDPAVCANPNAYVESTTEAGLLQVWVSRGSCGITTKAQAFDPTTNLSCGLSLWNTSTQALIRSYAPSGRLQRSEGYEFWAVAQLNTMIGDGATKKLLDLAGVRAGAEYTDLMNWVRAQGEGLATYQSSFCGASGCMTPGTVAWRVYLAGAMTQAAVAVGGLGGGFDDLGIYGVALVGAVGYYIAKHYSS